MIAIFVFLLIIFGVNCLPFIFKNKFKDFEKVVKKALMFSLIIFFVFTVLLFNDIRLKGIYSYLIIGILFFFSCLFYFAIVENTRKKILLTILLLPTILFGFLLLIFSDVKYQTKLNNKYDLQVVDGGFMTCGENIRVVESKYFVFYKEIKQVNGLCVIGIEKIMIDNVVNNKFDLLIFHNGEMDSENPLHYELDLDQ